MSVPVGRVPSLANLPHRGPRRAGLLAALVTMGVASTATSQPMPIVEISESGLVETESVRTVRLNPAAVAMLPGSSFGLHSAVRLEDSALQGLGVAGALRLGGFGLGIAWDQVQTPIDAGVLRTSLGVASERFGIGLSQKHVVTSDARAYDGLRSTDLGMIWRPTQWLGASVVARNLQRPRVGDVRMPRIWAFGLGLRTPRGHGQLQVSYEGEESALDDGVLRGDVRVRVVDGLDVFADAAFAVQDLSTIARVGGGVTVRLGGTAISGGVRHLEGDGLRSLTGVEVQLPHPVQLLSASERLVRVDIGGDLPEHPGGAGLFGSGGTPFTDLLATLDAVARRDDVGGVYVVSGGLRAGGAQLVELRGALDAVSASGKTVVVYLEQATFRDLYVAGAADIVLASPNLYVIEGGVSLTRTYLAGLLDLLGIRAQFVRIGEWKSAPERFTRRAPSEAAQDDFARFWNTYWETIRDGIGTRRNLTADDVNALLDEAPLSPATLERAGLVDAVVYRDEVERALREASGRRFSVTNAPRGFAEVDPSWHTSFRVAVLHIDGPITSGAGGYALLSGTQSTGDEDVRLAVAEIEADGRYDGVIVRIDSPGGLAVASDLMHRQLSRLSQRMPVRVSLGDMATSGGYYAAAIGAPIHTTPITLTGSIGIFAGTADPTPLLARLGVERIRETRGGISDLLGFRTWSDDEVAAMQRYIQDGYDQFLDRISTSREMPRDAVDAVAQGHIWSGADAMTHGLVDHVDGFLGAVDSLRVAAHEPATQAVTLVHFPNRQGLASALRVTLALAETPSPTATVVEALGLQSAATWIELLASHPGAAMALLPAVVDGL